MIYFLGNSLMYLFLAVLLYQYFRRRGLTLLDFLLMLFNINIYMILLWQEINFFYGALFSLMTILIKELYYNGEKMIKRNKEEIMLIKDGNVNFHELVKNHYSYRRLINYLRYRRIKIDEVAYCFLRNQDLIVVKSEHIKHFPISVIVDGQVLHNNLFLLKKDYDWLINEVASKHLAIDDIDYAYYKGDKIYFITKKETLLLNQMA